MPRVLFFFLCLVLVGVEQQGLEAQDPSAPKKPITLFDPDLSPAQKAVHALIQKAATEDRMGEYGSAIKTFEVALQQLRSIPEMKGEEDSLLVRLGRAYFGARRLDDAVRTFASLLGPRREDCRQDVAAVEYCADAQYYIGFANMQKSNFEAAVPFLTKSMASYGRAAGESEFVEYRMIKLKQQAETEALLAAGLLRIGHKDRAIDSLNHAITQLSTVERNEEIQESIRASARKSLQDARAVLELTLKN
jgi:tetratricopeptide (TPR) repeat protein